MKKKLTLLLILVLQGCATIDEKMQEKYGQPLQVVNYKDSSYKIVVNANKKEIFVKDNDSTAEKLFSPKYGALGQILDATEVLGREATYREVANHYLTINLPGCMTTGDAPLKYQMQCYEFKYYCE